MVTSAIGAANPSNPLGSTVAMARGAWLDGYLARPWMLAAPALGLAGAALAWTGLNVRAAWTALLGSSLAIMGIIGTAGLSLFPFLLPSSSDPRASLTAWDALSSHLTLLTMLLATCVFLPIVLAYTAWVYRVMRGTVTADSIRRKPPSRSPRSPADLVGQVRNRLAKALRGDGRPSRAGDA